MLEKSFFLVFFCITNYKVQKYMNVFLLKTIKQLNYLCERIGSLLYSSLFYILIFVTSFTMYITQSCSECCGRKEGPYSLYNKKTIYYYQKKYSYVNNKDDLKAKKNSYVAKVSLKKKRNIDFKKNPKLGKKKNNINNSNETATIKKISSCEKIKNIKYEDIDQKKDPEALGSFIKYFFTDSNIDDIKLDDLFMFFSHYRSKESEFLSEGLHYILFELLSSSVDNEKLIGFLKYRFGLTDNNMEDFYDYCIISEQIDNGILLYESKYNKNLYLKKEMTTTDLNKLNKNNDLKSIKQDLERVHMYDKNTPIKIDRKGINFTNHIKCISEIILNFLIKHPDAGGYAQSMPNIASFFCFLTAKQFSGNLQVDVKLAYNLFYHFLTYKFDDIIFGIENPKVSLVDFSETQKLLLIDANKEEFTKYIIEKFFKLPHPKEYESTKEEMRERLSPCFSSILLTYFIHYVKDFSVSKSIILLLFLFNNQFLFLDILAIYTIRNADAICEKIKNKNCSKKELPNNIIDLRYFLDNISNYK